MCSGTLSRAASPFTVLESTGHQPTHSARRSYASLCSDALLRHASSHRRSCSLAKRRWAPGVL
eukprot:5382959-Prymnesium_polylepis.1